MATSGYVLRRWTPTMLLALGAGALTGASRGSFGFAIGVQGMLVLGVLGYAAGRLGRGDPERDWTFSQRVGLALAAALLFGCAEVVALSALNAGPYDGPLEWLGDVIHGYTRESARAVTHATGRGRGLALTGAWWVFFTLLDVLLGAFVFLAATVAGLAPAGDGGSDDAAGEQRGSSTALRLFAAVVAVLALAVGVAWIRHAEGRETQVLSLDNLRRNQRLLGDWQLLEADRPGRIPDAQRRFELKLLGMDDVAAVPMEAGAFMLVLHPVGRTAARFEGRLEPGPGFAWFEAPPLGAGPLGYDVEATVADATLRLVVRRGIGDKRGFVARRRAAAP